MLITDILAEIDELLPKGSVSSVSQATRRRWIRDAIQALSLAAPRYIKTQIDLVADQSQYLLPSTILYVSKAYLQPHNSQAWNDRIILSPTSAAENVERLRSAARCYLIRRSSQRGVRPQIELSSNNYGTGYQLVIEAAHRHAFDVDGGHLSIPASVEVALSAYLDYAIIDNRRRTESARCSVEQLKALREASDDALERFHALLEGEELDALPRFQNWSPMISGEYHSVY